MKTLSFTHQNQKLTKTLRVHYGLEGMKYIIQIYEGEFNGHREKEGLPTEYQYEFEQEMFKHIHDSRRIRERRRISRDPSDLISERNRKETVPGENDSMSDFQKIFPCEKSI